MTLVLTLVNHSQYIAAAVPQGSTNARVLSTQRQGELSVPQTVPLHEYHLVAEYIDITVLSH